MKHLVYMDGEPIQHPDIKGRELPFKPCSVYTDLELERIYISATAVESFINHIYRIQSVEEAYNELMECYKDSLKNYSDNIVDQNRLERRIRSYFLESDVFFSHWRRFFVQQARNRSNKNTNRNTDIYRSIEDKYKGNNTYALLRIIRNYVMHAGDIMHGINVGTNGEFCVWTDVNVLIDDIRDSHDRCVLSNAGKRIDLIKLSNDSFPIILQIHEDFLEAVSDEKTVEALSILVSMQNKIMMYKSNIWFVFDYTGIEGVKPELPIIGKIPGLGMNYRRLYWNVYKNLYDKLKKKEIMNS